MLDNRQSKTGVASAVMGTISSLLMLVRSSPRLAALVVPESIDAYAAFALGILPALAALVLVVIGVVLSLVEVAQQRRRRVLA